MSVYDSIDEYFEEEPLERNAIRKNKLKNILEQDNWDDYFPYWVLPIWQDIPFDSELWWE